MLDIFVVCAEKSGDNLGYHYIKKILKNDPNTTISGVLGPKLSLLNIDKFMDIQKFSVIGFGAVLQKIPSLICSFYKIKRKILKEKPKRVLLIDSPDLTLRLAKALKKSGYKGHITQYVCPSIWIWRASRKKLIEKYIDKLLCLLQFEPALFEDTSVEAQLVPHPMLEEITQYKYPFSLKEIKGEKVLLLLPGSRISEIKSHLPLLLKVSKRFTEFTPCLLIASSKHLVAITKILIKCNATPFLVESSAKYDIMRRADIAIAKCGSTNLELALHETPTVVVYSPSKLDRLIGKYIFRINPKFFSLPNIILKKLVYREHIRAKPTEDIITASLENLMLKENYTTCKKNCKELKLLMQKN